MSCRYDLMRLGGKDAICDDINLDRCVWRAVVVVSFIDQRY